MSVVIGPASDRVLPKDLADLLWSTDPLLNGYMFGSMPVLHRIIANEWPKDRGLFSYRNAFTAIEGDHILGLLVGHTEEEYATNFDVSVENQPAALGAADAEHLRSALYWMDRLFPVPRRGSFYILEFAVTPQAQGAGIAGQLFAAAEARARAKGCTKISLDVAADNAAVGFYRHLGFQVDVETRVPVLEAAHGIGLHLHMVREIGAPV